MKTLGNFKTYHDLEKSSAVIYLEKTDSLVSNFSHHHSNKYN